MSEEIQNEVVNEIVPEPKAELSHWEEQAIGQGWKPKEEWEGNPDDWRPAKEFVERGELFGKISNQSGEIKELRKALNYLVDHHQKVKDIEFKRAVEHLKGQKKLALEDGDADKLIAVDEALLELKESAKQSKQIDIVKENPNPTPGFVEFVQTNPWYNADKEMKDFADEVGVGYFQRNPGVAEKDLYDYVTKRVKQAFPDKFKKKDIIPSVEGESGSRPTSRTNSKEFPLTDEERHTMNTFIRSGVMSKEEYISELKKIKGVA